MVSRPSGIGSLRPTGGVGNMTEALNAVIADFVADGMHDALYSAFVHDNIASWRVQKKLGFERVGEGMIVIVSRGCEVLEVRTRLTREAFGKATS